MSNDQKPGKRPRVMAVANQKGGVGKTTTVINLGAALAEAGKRTLIVDLDPQGNASTGLGFDPADRLASVDEVIAGDRSLESAAVKAGLDGLFLIASSDRLSSADIEMAKSERRLSFLPDALTDEALNQLAVEYVLIDCPPSLNLLTLNAMVAAESVLVPLQAEFYALEGLSQLILSIREVRKSANPPLAIEGVLLTMFDGRNNLSRQVETDARENLRDLVFKTVIPRNVRLSEAPSHGIPATIYDRRSPGAKAHQNLAKEILQNHWRLDMG